ncbi:MAG TPA: hypothetical protein VE133_01655 [Candidatus Sulfotelmatobacter sp.]|nr:hypothetical protein [Candidatus Sulfotelmatobacter sp.]
MRSSSTLHRIFLFSGLVMLAASASAQDNNKICTTVRPVTVCPNPLKPGGKPCADLPKDVNFKQLENGYSTLNPVCQQPFDDFSWQSFVALNWPLNDLSQPRPWERYTDPYIIFNPPQLKQALVAEQKEKVKVLYRMAKQHPLTPQQSTPFLEATEQPLVDRNLNFALYEERVNQVWTTYVTTTAHLSTVAGQKAFIAAKRNVKFPLGHYLNDQQGTGGALGATELKATWRILDPKKGDKLENFYIRKADIYMDADHTVNHQPLVVKGVIVGLVALHINTYTKDGKGSVWSTFEQEDNAPPQGKTEPGKTYSFFNLACKQCQLNTPPAKIGTEQNYLWGTTAPYAQRYAIAGQYGTQVTIVNAFYPETEDTNTRWHKLMPNTVWTHYRLIGTQWVNGEVPSPAGIPPVLANSTLETYVPQSQSSCISCHASATLNPPPQPKADLSFLLSHAH